MSLAWSFSVEFTVWLILEPHNGLPENNKYYWDIGYFYGNGLKVRMIAMLFAFILTYQREKGRIVRYQIFLVMEQMDYKTQ